MQTNNSIFANLVHNAIALSDQKTGGAINQKGGHIFNILYWMYAATRGPNVKWGDRALLPPPAGDGPEL